MLKLLKWELRQAGRSLLPLAGAYLAIACVTAGMIALNRRWFVLEQDTAAAGMSLSLRTAASPVLGAASVVLFAALVLGAMALTAATVIVNVQRFYRMLGQEGYLAFSLPVTAAAHIGAKLLCAVLCTALAVAAALAGVWIILLGAGAAVSLPGVPADTAAWLAAGGLASIASGYLTAYLACAIGMGRGRNRLAASLLAFTALVVLGQLALLGLGLALARTGFFRITLLPWMVHAANGGAGLPGWIMALTCCVPLAAGTVCFVLTRWLLARRLNLP